MLFLIDENLPRALGNVFEEKGFSVVHVSDRADLRQRSDEEIFAHAVSEEAVIVTRDLGFGNPVRFPLERLAGLVVLRFPNEISISAICEEVGKLTRDFEEKDFRNMLVIEPGLIRRRPLLHSPAA